jgi:hypothetical protein
MGVIVMGLFHCNTAEGSGIREPAVAGQFYPGDPAQLTSFIRDALAAAEPAGCSPQLFISPHAGYIFSGAVAARGYAQISPAISRVFVLGPAHRYPVKGVSIPDVEAYRTPLGDVAIDKEVVNALRKSDLVECTPRAHAEEHAIEVQLPFLQHVLDEFTFIPVLLHNAPPQEVARLIEPYITEHTLVVASTDLSHFHPYEEANKIDERSIETIMNNDTDGPIEACGENGVRALMYCARSLNLTPRLLAHKNSHDAAPMHAPKDRVVGYASIIYCPAGTADNTSAAQSRAHKRGGTRQQAAGSDDTTTQTEDTPGSPLSFTPSQQRYMLTLARSSLEAAVHGKPAPSCDDAPEALTRKRGCFVTLRAHGDLRGCIGYIQPVKPLCTALIDNARNAALHDHRFSPVRAAELDDITIEISVLSQPEPITYDNPSDLLEKIVPGKDGIILNKGMHQATYLPQVWQQLNDKTTFLQQLSRKAGMSRDGWKNAEVQRYRVIHFEETE